MSSLSVTAMLQACSCVIYSTPVSTYVPQAASKTQTTVAIPRSTGVCHSYDGGFLREEVVDFKTFCNYYMS